LVDGFYHAQVEKVPYRAVIKRTENRKCFFLQIQDESFRRLSLFSLLKADLETWVYDIRYFEPTTEAQAMEPEANARAL
jgi:hypothetical protein